MANQYGIDDTSLLSGPDATTARQIQEAFVNARNAQQRASMRYSLPQLANFNEDNALAQAQTSAGLINNNTQLQHVLDSMKDLYGQHSPHGFGQNLASVLSTLGGVQRLIPTLFGSNAASTFGREGLVGVVKKWFKDPNTGTSYGMDGNGKVVTAYDENGNVIPGYGMYDRGTGGMGSSADWPTGAGGSTDFGSDFGAGAGAQIIPPMDWTTGFGGDFTPPADWGASAAGDVASYFGF